MWRDLRVIEECYWYGWFIDYWVSSSQSHLLLQYLIDVRVLIRLLSQPIRIMHSILHADGRWLNARYFHA